MKKLACEMCGSTNVVKEDGLYVCQSCGAKYSPEEAKKMMVEGTVQIDYSSKVDNHKNLLEKAIERERWKDVKKYSDEILAIDSGNSDATFYKELAECWISEINDFKEGYDIISAFNDAINILEEENSDEIGEVIVKYSNQISPLINSIQNTSVNIYNSRQKESWQYSNGSDVRKDAKNFYISNITLCIDLLTQIINFFHKYSDEIKNNENLKKEGFDFNDALLNFLKQKDFELSELVNQQSNSQVRAEKEKNLEEIKKYDENYVPEKNNNCYIATSVYGSYDCPEVWTLRRFRDNILDNSLYGKLFIKFYYAVSPTLVKFFGNKKWFKNLFKGRLDSFVKKLQDEGIKSTFYIDK